MSKYNLQFFLPFFEHCITTRYTAATHMCSGMNLKSTLPNVGTHLHFHTAYQQLKFCVKSILKQIENEKNTESSFDLTIWTIPL